MYFVVYVAFLFVSVMSIALSCLVLFVLLVCFNISVSVICFLRSFFFYLMYILSSLFGVTTAMSGIPYRVNIYCCQFAVFRIVRMMRRLTCRCRS